MFFPLNVGSSMEEAFYNLSDRCQNYDLDLVVTAIIIQRSAGGNLAEILENVTNTMRERFRIKAEIVTLTAQQSLTGIVIALRVGFGLALFVIVGAEFMGADAGLGHLIMEGRTFFNPAQIVIGALVLGLLGSLINTLLLAAERRLVRWRPEA